MWKPLGLDNFEANTIGNFGFPCIVRLKAGVSPARALAEINAAQQEISKNFPDGIELRAQMVPLSRQIAGRSQAGLQLLLGAVGVVLLIGCVNIINLLLAKATSRQKEMAVRSAIGASFGRLVRQALAESFLLAVIGGMAGLAVAHALLQIVLVYAPVDLPRMDEVRLDARLVGFTAALSLLTSVIVGLLPAWHSAKADPQQAMTSVSRPPRLDGRWPGCVPRSSAPRSV